MCVFRYSKNATLQKEPVLRNSPGSSSSPPSKPVPPACWAHSIQIITYLWLGGGTPQNVFCTQFRRMTSLTLATNPAINKHFLKLSLLWVRPIRTARSCSRGHLSKVFFFCILLFWATLVKLCVCYEAVGATNENCLYAGTSLVYCDVIAYRGSSLVKTTTS